MKSFGFFKAESWVDTSYIDETCRIARGNKGSVFLLTKINGNREEDVKDKMVEVGSKGEARGGLLRSWKITEQMGYWCKGSN